MMNYIEEFREHVQKYGVEGLLPQNLSENLLTRMIVEIDSYERNSDSAPASTILMAILSIQSGNIIEDSTDRVEVSFDSEDELMDKFNSYMTWVILEGLRRDKPINIPEDSLPTLKNIFDKDRKIEISGFE
jgi:hypothetical protein